MSTRYECISARSCQVTIAKAGEYLGEYPVDPGNIAVVFNYDEVVYIEGTPEECIKVLMTAINQVAANLQPEDLVIDEGMS